MEKINLAIVDDHTLFRDGLVNLLKESPLVSVLFEARNGKDMQLQLEKKGVPDIILMDINMPVMDGHDSARWLKEHYPHVYIIALSMYEDESSIIRMLRNGARGYILKECNADELMKAITSVYQTGYYLNEFVSGRLVHSVLNENEDKILTPREITFLELCCTELTYKEIAEKMTVSPRTIDGYRDLLFEKLSLKSRTGLVVYAIKNGIVNVNE